MKYILILVWGICFTLPTIDVQAQEIVSSPLRYYQEELFVNPAFAGSQHLTSVNLGINKQWASIEGSPMSQRLQANAPLFNDKMGLGLTMENQNNMVRNQLKFNGIYAYRIALEKGTLSLGLQLGLVTLQDHYTDLKTPVTDPEFASNSGLLWGFNFGTGVYYNTDKYYIGLSLPNFMDNSMKEGVDGELVNSLSADKFSYYLTGGYVFTLNEKIKLKPAALLNYRSSEFRYDVSATAFLQDKYYAGAFVRSTHELGATIGLNVINYLNIGYAVSFGYGQPYSYNGATHQFTIGFIWNKDKSKTKLKLF